MVVNHGAMKRQQTLPLIALTIAASVLSACSGRHSPAAYEDQVRGLIRKPSLSDLLGQNQLCTGTLNEQTWQIGDSIQQLVPISEIREILVHGPEPIDQIAAILLRGKLVDYRDLPAVHRVGIHSFAIVMDDGTCYSVGWDDLEDGVRLGSHWFAVGE